jgi:hypothetical protein
MEDEGNDMTNINWLSGIGLWELLETLCSHRLVEKLRCESVMGQAPVGSKAE